MIRSWRRCETWTSSRSRCRTRRRRSTTRAVRRTSSTGRCSASTAPRRQDAFDPETGELYDDVLVFRVDGADAKQLTLADPRGIFFTTPHWNGYPAVLVHIPDLEHLDRGELRAPRRGVAHTGAEASREGLAGGER